ncbi:aldo/keto reductase [Actinoplanes sp. LDG1-06]|uniref:Aldo/keto reductase n=1 Tax=Paractinoplanes ovalisporus TaxID=2810368 RepID=A0ABS2A478_9ACTN|nr:aldo/keto reductase [Actinoplanes ovalisporus]MBM2614627.1 aldo/keto reductase [Actinoplanes ovalisporus]
MGLFDELTGVARIGLGLAAVGRPGYINLGRDTDLPPSRSVEAMRERAHQLLSDAYDAGVRYFDVARSYGRAEEFLASWLPGHDDAIAGSKWGYTYTADWQVTADVHEVKDHSVATFDRQIGETRALLGDRLALYQIHSVTPDSPALTDTVLHRRLAGLGVPVGFSTSGPRQADTIRAALAVEVDGARLFRSVQSTWNVLETSAGPALAEARAAGCDVIVKEAMANGRLAGESVGAVRAVAAELGTTPDAVALAAVLRQPWSPVVLSGAATEAQLTSNLAAAAMPLSPDQLARLTAVAESPEQYWKTRSGLAWT